jgi:SAM-dependent methyltransferase
MNATARSEPAPQDGTRETPDIETSSAAYARRFAGAVGEWFLRVQAEATLRLLADWPGATVLDVGGGHGQLTRPLVDAGFRVTVYGSSPECAARLAPDLRSGRARFAAGDLFRAPFADRAFDVVLAFRLLPHVARWPTLCSELARLARHLVVVDYPTRRSVNAAAELLFGLKRRIERNTRPFLVFTDRDVETEFEAAGFRRTARRPEFFFPMALHRAIGAAALSRTAESCASSLGLTHLLGSPVLLRLERQRT